MRFLIKLLRVFIIIFIILITGYIIDEKDNIFVTKYNDDAISIEDNTKQHEKKDVSEHDQYEEYSIDETPSNSVNESIELNEAELNQNEESSKSNFTYDMKAIDKHSIGHLHEMQKIINEFNKSPHNHQDDLYNELYSKNFMHLEEELEEKNQPLYIYMIELIEFVEEHENFSDSKSIITILDEINIILDNIINIE